MIHFYLEARPMMNGRLVELSFYNGKRKGLKLPLGSLTLEAAEWEALRQIIIAGMSKVRIPVQIMDGTRRKPPDNVN